MSNGNLDKVKELLESAFAYAKQNEFPSPIDLAQLGGLIRFYDNGFTSQKYGYDKLNFYEGSIEEFEGVTQVDMVVTLHACDTATDYALYKALRWGASVILSVPCCQHELNKQISASEFEPITDYGILKERFCALATDGIRAKILEEQGYDTQILEFIDMEHTPKNLLIRALHRKKPSAKKREKASKEVNAFCEQFGFAPTLWKLLQEEGGVNNE